MRIILFFALLICACDISISHAQINFKNPSFEDDSLIAPCSNCYPKFWYPCSNNSGAVFSELIDPSIINHIFPTDGNFFSAIQTNDTLIFGDDKITLGQQLNCSIKAGKHYYFFIDITSVYSSPPPAGYGFIGNYCLQVLGTTDSCGLGEILFEHCAFDTTWQTLKVEFAPGNDYQYLVLKMKTPSNDNYVAEIDNLSPIYCNNYNEVTATTNDTIISAGAFVTLNAITTGSYDSVYWRSADSSFYKQALNNVIVHPIHSTQYVVATHSTDCGNFWSYDTVNVIIPDATQNLKQHIFSITPSINCANRSFKIECTSDCILQVYSVSGIMVNEFNFKSGENNFILNKQLPEVYYFCKILSDNKVTTQKIVLLK